MVGAQCTLFLFFPLFQRVLTAISPSVSAPMLSADVEVTAVRVHGDHQRPEVHDPEHPKGLSGTKFFPIDPFDLLDGSGCQNPCPPGESKVDAAEPRKLDSHLLAHAPFPHECLDPGAPDKFHLYAVQTGAGGWTSRDYAPALMRSFGEGPAVVDHPTSKFHGWFRPRHNTGICFVSSGHDFSRYADQFASP